MLAGWHGQTLIPQPRQCGLNFKHAARQDRLSDRNLGETCLAMEDVELASTAEASGETDATSAVIGPKIRMLRRSLSLSLQVLSDRTGISIGLLSQIERGISAPSLKNLVALSSALGIRTGWFFEEGHAGDDGEGHLIVRREFRRKITMASGTSMSKELLSPRRDGSLQMFILTLEPGGSTGEEPYSHPAEVGGYVVSGRLDLWLNGRSFVLRSGDSFSIPPNCLRRYSNADPREAVELVWSIAYPDRM
ncbi:cupin domain-containing protein [Roseomonas terrae]|jgi:transcriptional regulator with XRE-family HTH domain|uniref:Cupin domain-containing protein n=1 Tax=Neoroseomonas terrae TaxID=424799 RepID=A0ABS5EGM1_9PROT|nr:cupin domain-containing protein [Neoroseomonas terrae]